MSKKNKKERPQKFVVVDGLPNNTPFDLSEKKKQEIKERLEKVYGEVLKKKSDQK